MEELKAEMEQSAESDMSSVDNAGRRYEQLDELLLNTQEQCQMMQEQGEMMQSLIKNQIEVKDAMIDQLHKQLENYRQDDAARYTEQLMKAVIRVRQNMVKLMSTERFATMSVEDLRQEYNYVVEDLTNLLQQQNVDPYSSEPGAPFDGKIHTARTEATSDPALDKRIKQSLSEGYIMGNKTLITERVIAYKYEQV